jgi:hypothetical protein
MTGPRRVRLASAMALCALGTAVAVVPALHAQPLEQPAPRAAAASRMEAYERARGAT